MPSFAGCCGEPKLREASSFRPASATYLGNRTSRREEMLSSVRPSTEGFFSRSNSCPYPIWRRFHSLDRLSTCLPNVAAGADYAAFRGSDRLPTKRSDAAIIVADDVSIIGGG